MSIEALGPVTESEIKDLIDQIESEGNHYLSVPPVKGEWPKLTCGNYNIAEWKKTVERQIREVERAQSSKDSTVVKEIVDRIVPAAWK